MAKPFQITGSELVSRPEGCGCGHGVEIFQVHDAGCGFVVIPADEDAAEFPGAFAHFIGAGAVTDDVAQIDDEIERRSGGEAGIESFQVGVDVTQQQYAHRSPGKLPIIAESPFPVCGWFEAL